MIISFIKEFNASCVCKIHKRFKDFRTVLLKLLDSRILNRICNFEFSFKLLDK